MDLRNNLIKALCTMNTAQNLFRWRTNENWLFDCYFSTGNLIDPPSEVGDWIIVQDVAITFDCCLKTHQQAHHYKWPKILVQECKKPKNLIPFLSKMHVANLNHRNLSLRQWHHLVVGLQRICPIRIIDRIGSTQVFPIILGLCSWTAIRHNYCNVGCEILLRSIVWMNENSQCIRNS